MRRTSDVRLDTDYRRAMAVGYLLALRDHAGMAYGQCDILGFADWFALDAGWSLSQAYTRWCESASSHDQPNDQPAVSAIPRPRDPLSTATLRLIE